MTAARRVAPASLRPGSDPREYVEYERSALERFADLMRPDEGWISLPLVMFVVGTMAWSISDARWILGEDQLTGFLLWISLVAALWSYVAARLQLPPWLAQALGCTIGAFVVIEAVGMSMPGSRPGLAGWFQATAGSVTQAYLDLTWRHHATTTQTGHFALALGVLVWATAQAAAYDVFGYRRAINGVLLLGVVFVGNMALTPSDQFVALVAFSGAALMLLLLSHAADEREGWVRHRVWRGRDFEAPRIEGGVTFASMAVMGALILTLVASSAPLYGAINSLFGQTQGALNGLAGPNPGRPGTGTGDDYGDTSTIASVFKETPRDVFTIGVDSSSAPTHWRMVSYATFDSTSWSVGSDTTQDPILAESPLEAGTLDAAETTTPSRVPVSISVHLQDTTISHLIGAGEVASVNANVERTLVGTAPSSLDVVGFTTTSTNYVVSALVPNMDPNGSGVTEWLLQHAGTTYPAGLLSRYTQGVEKVGADGAALLAEIQAYAARNGNSFKDEYDVAKAIQTYLSGPAFTYDPDITAAMNERCGGLSTVDCFAIIRQGFCEQYATTMTMLMRMKGFPARYVLGYLPGPLDEHTRLEEVTNQQKHAWVEVYFPTYGWIPFDPTGGGVGSQTVLPKGSAVSASPTPGSSNGPGETGAAFARTPTPGPDQSGGSTSGSGGLGPILLIPGILILVAALALLLFWQRRFRRLDDPNAVYRDIVRLASRLGYRPRPTQTVYEYTGMLADAVPTVRESLDVVATASVEVTYGKRQLSAERLEFLATAHRLIRRVLLGMSMRLPGRNRPAPPSRRTTSRERYRG